MKLIIAYIQPERLNAVKQSLYDAGVCKMSITNALGCGQQRGYTESYRGVEDTVRRAEEHVSSAVAAIAAFPDGRAKSALHSAADFAVSRDR